MRKRTPPHVARVTVLVPYDLWTQFRLQCVHHHISASDVIREYIQEQVTIWEQTEEGDAQKKTYLSHH